eukprot:CAMPEP_0171322872 /NCGR_PEP_ID=MMETSP0816-20121228/115227_1 /TAXON_ID=420281 /ORGANISM="Proboscia inermis, Strain CCAP1064/1" /LENGTH=54 /DNA_ID=CAMNT_0011821447 /DNA_START=573 /DNA_END=737 /DNA_ORIENTATION=-
MKEVSGIVVMPWVAEVSSIVSQRSVMPLVVGDNISTAKMVTKLPVCKPVQTGRE